MPQDYPLKQPSRLLVFFFGLSFFLAAFLIMTLTIKQDQEGRIIGNPSNFSLEGPITTIDTILTAPEAENLLGMTVLLERAPVFSVVGDSIFWIGPSSGQKIAVVLQSELMNRQRENRVQIVPNQLIRLLGTIRYFDQFLETGDFPQLNATERSELEKQKIYISAQIVQVIPRQEEP